MCNKKQLETNTYWILCCGFLQNKLLKYKCNQQKGDKMETNTNETNESVAITEEEFKRFLSATGEEQWKLLLAHAEKNKKFPSGT